MKQDKFTTIFSALAIIGVIMFVMGGNANFVPAGSDTTYIRVLGIILLVVGIGGAIVKAVISYRKDKDDDNKGN